MNTRAWPRMMAWAALLAVAACASGGFSPQPPDMRGAPKLWVPAFTTARLPSGLTLHVNPDPYLPMVSIAVGLRGGYLIDRPGKSGLAHFFAQNLVTRCERFDHLGLAATFDVVGAPVDAQVMADGILLTIDVLEDRAAGALKLMAELLSRPGFDEATMERVRLQQRSNLEDGFGNPATAATWGLRQVLFGPRHPMAVPALGTRSSLAGLSLADLQERARLVLRPDQAVVVVAGRVDPQMVLQVVQNVFAGWTAPASGAVTVDSLLAQVGPGPEPEKRTRVHYIAQAGASQTTVVVGRRGLPITDPHYDHLRLVSGRAPADASSWLRGTVQVTYGVGGIADANTRTGYFGATLTVDTPSTGMALESLLSRYGARLDGSVDIEKVLLLSREGLPYYTLAGRTASVAGHFVSGRPLDYFAQLRQRIDDERAQNVELVAETFIDDDRMQVVLVGDEAALRAQIPGIDEGTLTPLLLTAAQ
jgi:zinc protease